MTLSSDPLDGLVANRVAGRLGAVEGVDLARPLSDDTARWLRERLLEHKVLFFRDQHLTHAQHVQFGRHFGTLTPAHPHEVDAPRDHPEILTVDLRINADRYGVSEAERHRDEPGFRSGWHTDLTPVVNPPAICILRAERVPDYGGDTTWSSLAAAYATLSEPVQHLLATLHARHAYENAVQQDATGRDTYRDRLRATRYESIHPVVRIHPETGEPALFVNPHFTSRIVELSGVESARVLGLLFEQIARPTFTVRFRWSPGSVAMWDNRITAHLIPSDIDHLGVERRMHRVATVGDLPVGLAGEHSVSLAGPPFPAGVDLQKLDSGQEVRLQ